MNHVSTCLLVCHHFSHHRITITSGITTYCSLATLVLLLLLGFLFVRLFSFSLLFAGHLLPCSVDLIGFLNPKKKTIFAPNPATALAVLSTLCWFQGRKVLSLF